MIIVGVLELASLPTMKLFQWVTTIRAQVSAVSKNVVTTERSQFFLIDDLQVFWAPKFSCLMRLIWVVVNVRKHDRCPLLHLQLHSTEGNIYRRRHVTGKEYNQTHLRTAHELFSSSAHQQSNVCAARFFALSPYSSLSEL